MSDHLPSSASPREVEAAVRAGFEHLTAGRREQAEAAARAIVAAHPRHHGALNLAALACLERGEAGEAVTLWRRAIAAAPDEPVYRCNLAAALRRDNRHEEAIAAAGEALRLRPGYPEALVNLGAAQFAAERYAEALAAFDEALALPGAEPLLHAYRGDALRMLGRVRAAIGAYRRALELAPDLHHAIGNLGVTLLGVGQPEQALELCRRATELAPGDGTAWMNLGTTLRTLGRLREAMDAFALAHERAPRSARLCTLIGDVWQEVGDLPQALAWYHEALELEPGRIEAQCGMADASAGLGDSGAAVARYRELAERHPDHLRVQSGLGTALWEDGDAEGAVAACREAVRLAPENATALARLASVLASAGNVEAANEANRAALEVNPRCVPALANLAQNLRGGLADEHAAQMRRLLAARWPTEGPRAALHFGLGHHHDGRGEHDDAARHVAEANALHLAFKRERGWDYDPAAWRRHVDELIAFFQPAFFARSRGLGDASETPVFIVGMPRSGTTLTEQILASHPRVFGAGERNFAAQGLRRLPAAAGRADEPPLAVLGEARAEPLRRVARWHLGRLGALADKASVAAAGAERIVDKLPDNYGLLGWIVTLFPNARVIHCRRDLRDVAVSCWVTQFRELRWAFDLEHLAERLVEYRRLMAHWRRVLPVPMLEIDYEDTVADPAAQTARLLDFLGLPWDDRCLQFHRTERLVRTASVTQVRQPIHRRSVERWRRYERQLAPLLRRLEEG